MRKFLALFLIATSAFAAPVYNAGSPIDMNYASSPVALWSAESPTPGNGGNAASQQVLLRNRGAGSAFGVDGRFSAAPGAFEVDVQVAAVDNDADYQTISGGNITTVDSVNQTFHLDATGVSAKYARLLMRTRTNAVSITARLSQ